MKTINSDRNCHLQAAWVREDKAPPGDWPQHGVVEFKDYSTRYRPGLDLVLTQVTCQINSGEKVWKSRQ